jgi:hypothetical protein
MDICAGCGAELPAEARFCPACGSPVDQVAEPADERKVATVLFADLVGSTELGEQDPERTRALLSRFYDAMAAEIEELACDWPAIAALEPLARERVAANLSTPCIRNARTLLLCAVAAERGGDPSAPTISRTSRGRCASQATAMSSLLRSCVWRWPAAISTRSSGFCCRETRRVGPGVSGGG